MDFLITCFCLVVSTHHITLGHEIDGFLYKNEWACTQQAILPSVFFSVQILCTSFMSHLTLPARS